MPKIIDNVSELILMTAKDLLLERGYQGLNMRIVAKRSHIGIGTIYNYYESKEVLVASIMLVDWKQSLDNIEKKVINASNMRQVLYGVYSEILEFYQIYQPTWKGYEFSRYSTYSFQERHQLLRKQLANFIQKGLDRLTSEANDYLATYLAGDILQMCIYTDFEYEKIVDIWRRVIGVNTFDWTSDSAMEMNEESGGE